MISKSDDERKDPLFQKNGKGDLFSKSDLVLPYKQGVRFVPNVSEYEI